MFKQVVYSSYLLSCWEASIYCPKMKINATSKKAKPTNKTENFLGKILVGMKFINIWIDFWSAGK